ncbi:MAG: HEAT repeat domain-containing protein [Polyangiaceae bacterium]
MSGLARSFRVSALLAVAVLLPACAVSPAVEAARARDMKKLSDAMASERKAGDFDSGEVRDVARAVAEAEIGGAKGVEGEELIRSLASCARELHGALDDRFDKGDDEGAVAAEVLLSAGVVSNDEYAKFIRRDDATPAYRALGARSLTDDDDFGMRRKLFLDLDERVRVNALKAAMLAPTIEDFDALVEAGRVDPNPAARSAAVRALGRIGGERSVVALKDIWLHADERLRESVVDGFMAPPAFEAGGREQLVRLAENGGDGSIPAAIALSHVIVGEGPDRVAHDTAIGVLTRTIQQGTRDQRTLAIVMSPSEPTVLEAIRKAQEDGDTGIAMVALGRVALEGKDDEKKAARDKLLELAKSDDPEASRAMRELANAGDKRVVELLVKQLASENPYDRAYAARSLVTLGELEKASVVLSDAKPFVRAAVACEMIRDR